MKIYLIRHPEVENSGKRVFAGQYDIPLSTCGNKQVTQIAQCGKLLNLTSIIASPLTRTLVTAQALSDSTGLAVNLEPGFKEVSFGDWEGELEEEVARRNASLYAQYGCADLNFRFPGGEKLQEFKERLINRFFSLVDQYRSAPDEQVIALITHAGVIRMILLSILRLEFSMIWRFKVDYASISLLEYKMGYASICGLNDLCPLQETACL